MNVIIHPSKLKGSVAIPPSKSVMQRACAAALIRKGVTTIQNPGKAEDDRVAISIIQNLGANCLESQGQLRVESKGIFPVTSTLQCGESGLSSRMFLSIAACTKEKLVFDGSGTLLKRPFDFFENVLPALGVKVLSNHGRLPLTVKGPLVPRNLEIDGGSSSQYVTGLLFAYAAAKASDVTIRLRNPKSKPYLDLTLQLMKQFGLHTPEQTADGFYFPPAVDDNLESQPFSYRIEGDWSSAAFLLVAGAIAGEVMVRGLDLFSVQADKAVLQALMQAGAGISIETDSVMVRKSRLKPFHVNAVDSPDLFPPLAALACYCEGSSVIEGVHRLTNKESDRARTIETEFAKLGVEVIMQDDLMIIRGKGAVQGGQVLSHHDHRIAMACAVAALGAGGPVKISRADAVNKSYPGFWEDLSQLNASISLDNN